ncbi:MAG: DNA polymerase III subunit alpha [Deltaproteobacteria bacterium]|jgi:DNA polymerase-3 subunit alpha|nr:DNA polymerase III subunit alpha [Deltaproteobacteria bacterium]
MSFVHLHVRSCYSFLAGTIRVPALVSRVKELGMDAVALTDLGQMFGIWEFQRLASAEGIRAIPGAEFHVAPRGRRTHVSDESAGTLVFLATDLAGYRNLVRLTARANTEGFFHKPRVDTELLQEHGAGLVCLSSGSMGEIPALLRQGNLRAARDCAEVYARLFPGRFSLEIRPAGPDSSVEEREGLKELARVAGLPLVAAGECCCLDAAEEGAYEVLRCVRTRIPFEDPSLAVTRGGGGLVLKGPAEMRSEFADCPEACDQAVSLAASCQVELPQRRAFSAPRPDIGVGVRPSEDFRERADDFLMKAARDGLERRLGELEARDTDFGEVSKEPYRDRLRRETADVLAAGASQYVLVVADYAARAREEGIELGTGCGPSASSLVCWALGITDVDPVEHDLHPEFFVNPETRDHPRIEIEAPPERAPEIIGYITETYGGSHFAAHSLSLEVLRGRALVREVGRAFGFPLKVMDDLCGMLPDHSGISLETALKEISLFREAADRNPLIRKIVDVCLVLDGLPRSAAASPNSLVVSPRLLRDSVPLFLDFGAIGGRRPETAVQFDARAVEENGLLRFDVTPSKTLSLLSACLKLIDHNGGRLDLSAVPLDDPGTLALLSEGNTSGIPFLGNYWVAAALKTLKNLSFQDLVALRALHPPLFNDYAVCAAYLDARRGGPRPCAQHQALLPVLAPTCGVFLYMEQLCEAVDAVTRCGFPLAELLVRSMARDDLEELSVKKPPFLSLVEANGLPERDAAELWDRLVFHSRISPSKGEAVSRALSGYRMAYVKAHYPAEFLDAFTSQEDTNTQEREKALKEWRNSFIRLVPPPGREA